MTGYALHLIDGLQETWLMLPASCVSPGRDLANGETFASHDACTWTRHGDELAVWTPGKVEALAA